jgi:pyruvate kinase
VSEANETQPKIKILATLGPSSNTAEKIEDLFRAGADIFRINMSHTSHERCASWLRIIRGIETKHERPIGILADLQGRKLRTGRFEGAAVQLERGQTLPLDSDEALGTSDGCWLPHPEILKRCSPATASCSTTAASACAFPRWSAAAPSTEVDAGQELSDRKGVSLPDTNPALRRADEKDRRDLDAALAEEVDWVALSFIQRGDDVAEARKIVAGRAGIMSKIEKPQAVDRIEEIMDLSDAIMVARGDLGVEMPLESVPGVQKQITRAARRLGKPVVVATQMLESMITAPVPTRAEVSDVATAVFEGADAVMLSAESAAGEYPRRGSRNDEPHRRVVEQDRLFSGIIHAQRTEPESTAADTITSAARQIGETLGLAGDRVLHRFRLHGPARFPRTAGRTDRRLVAGAQNRPAACRSFGACIAWLWKTSTTSMTWSTGLAPLRTKRVLLRRVNASSSPPACPSSSPARRTCCASLSSARTDVPASDGAYSAASRSRSF